MATNETKIILSADDKTGAAFKSAQRSISSLTSAAAGLGVVLSAGAFTGFVKSSIDAADSLNDLSKSTGASVETLAGLQLAAKQSGVELDIVAKGMLKFSGLVLDASNGTKAAADKISALGLNLKTLAAQSPEQQFIALAGALEKFGAEKQGIIVADVLGAKMAALTPLLSEGATGLGNMIAKGKELNPVTTEMAKQADAFNDELAKVSVSASAVGLSLAGRMLPAMNDVAIAMIKAQKESGNLAALVTGLGGVIVAAFGGPTSQLDLASNNAKKLFNELFSAKEKLNELQATKSGGGLSGLLVTDADIERNKRYVDDVQKRLKAVVAYRDGLVKAIDVPDPAKAQPQAEYKITDNKHAKEMLALAEKQQKAMQESNQWAADSYSEQLRDANKVQSEWKTQAAETARNFVDMISPADELVRKMQTVEFLMETINEETGKPFLSADQGQLALLDLNDQVDKLNTVKDAGKDAFADLTRAVEGWGNAFTDTMTDMVMTGKFSFTDMSNSIIRDLIRMSVQANITEPLFKSFQSGLSGSGSGDSGGGWMSAIASFFTASAKGNVFSGPGISAYSGQVVSSPTVFPFAKGIGLMGEAGSEAIMPLKRSSNGSLGVTAEGFGGSGVVVNIIESPDRGGQTEQRNQGGQTVLDVFVDKVKSSLNRDLVLGNGIAGTLERRYGLNPAAGASR